jgi:hypothetical protein
LAAVGPHFVFFYLLAAVARSFFCFRYAPVAAVARSLIHFFYFSFDFFLVFLFFFQVKRIKIAPFVPMDHTTDPLPPRGG